MKQQKWFKWLHHSEKHPMFASISLKLTFFMVTLIGLLLILVWILNVHLLDFFYRNRILHDLNRTADDFAALIDQHEFHDAIPDLTRDPAFMEALTKDGYIDSLADKCIEISNSRGEWVFGAHFLSSTECLIHPLEHGLFGNKKILWDNPNSIALRKHTREMTHDHFTLTQHQQQQTVIGRTTNSGYTILVSANLARVGQASQVISLQMPIIATVLLVAAMIGCYWFSRWFTRPVLQLSEAAKEMAHGNYRVRVTPQSGDEIGILTEDFNRMALAIENANEQQQDLIANVSHDLRTPLTLIKGYAETLRDINGHETEKRQEQLNIIIDETDRLSALVNSVMDLSKYSSGVIQPQRITFNLSQMCEEVADRYENICSQNGYTLDVQASQIARIEADPESIQRVIHNLLANAVHHVGEDGYLALRCIVQENKLVRVEIEDHGKGILKEDLPHIFDKYYRSRADSGKVGTGLGLSITKAILVNHGFAFGVQSEQEKGTTFWFEAPLALPTQPS